MPISPLYVCPDCEPGPYLYAGKVIPKCCSACLALRRDAQTGYDRARTGADRGRFVTGRPRVIPVRMPTKLPPKFRIQPVDAPIEINTPPQFRRFKRFKRPWLA